MKIQYTDNICDIDEVDNENYGEIQIFFKDGKIAYHHDYSDGVLEIDCVENLMEAFGVDIKFEHIRPDENQIKQINKYLKKHC
jgi:hypothetical protein